MAGSRRKLIASEQFEVNYLITPVNQLSKEQTRDTTTSSSLCHLTAIVLTRCASPGVFSSTCNQEVLLYKSLPPTILHSNLEVCPFTQSHKSHKSHKECNTNQQLSSLNIVNVSIPSHFLKRDMLGPVRSTYTSEKRSWCWAVDLWQTRSWWWLGQAAGRSTRS